MLIFRPTNQQYVLAGLQTTIKETILGKRPYNTVFSFNYHNISHIVRFQKRVVKQHLSPDAGVLVDVGCGASPYYELFGPVVKAYHAVDMEEALPETENRPIKQHVGFAEDLPLADQMADVVISNQVLEHVLDERKAVAESYRILKPGGYFIGSVPHISPIHLEPYDFRRLTYLGLKKLLEDAGFEVLEIEGNGGVHKALAFTLTMDWFMNSFQEGRSQHFSTIKNLALFPLVGLINIMAIVGDAIVGDKKRSPSNYCWVARKPV